MSEPIGIEETFDLEASRELDRKLQSAAAILKCQPEQILERITKVQEDIASKREQLEQLPIGIEETLAYLRASFGPAPNTSGLETQAPDFTDDDIGEDDEPECPRSEDGNHNWRFVDYTFDEMESLYRCSECGKEVLE